MSYCRWSSDNWRCDVYCYVDGTNDGYTTHVTARRVLGDIPLEPKLSLLLRGDAEERLAFITQHNAVMRFLDTAERAPIGLSRDGETIIDSDLTSFLATLESLRDEGYNVPAYVIEDVRAEIEQENACPETTT